MSLWKMTKWLGVLFVTTVVVRNVLGSGEKAGGDDGYLESVPKLTQVDRISELNIKNQTITLNEKGLVGGDKDGSNNNFSKSGHKSGDVTKVTFPSVEDYETLNFNTEIGVQNVLQQDGGDGATTKPPFDLSLSYLRRKILRDRNVHLSRRKRYVCGSPAQQYRYQQIPDCVGWTYYRPYKVNCKTSPVARIHIQTYPSNCQPITPKPTIYTYTGPAKTWYGPKYGESHRRSCLENKSLRIIF